MKRCVYLAVLGLVILTVAACQSSSEPQQLPTEIPSFTPVPTSTVTPTPSPTPAIIPPMLATNPEDQAEIRVVHALPGIDAVDVYIEARALAYNLGPGQFISPAGIEAGDYILRIQQAGVALHAVEPYVEQNISIAGGDSLLILFTGTPETATIATYQESHEPLERGKSRVSFINAIPRGPVTSLLRDGVEITQPVDFGQQSAEVIVDAGNASLTAQSGDQMIVNQTMQLRDRNSYMFVLMGTADDLASAEIIQFGTQVPGISMLRAVHLAPDVDPVDIYLNNEIYTSGLAYSTSTERQTTPTGSYIASVYPAGSDTDTTESLTSVQFNTNADDNVALLLLGTPDDLRLIRYNEDVSPVATGQVRMAFANGLASARNVRVDLLGEETVSKELPDLTYRSISPQIEFDANTYTFYWSIYQGGTQGAAVETAEDVQLEPGRSYIYVMTGRAPEQAPLIISEVVGQDENLVPVGVDVEPTVTPSPATTVRMANIITSGNPVDFFLNDTPFVSNTPYAQVSSPVIVLETTQEISARLAGTDTEVASLTYEFQPGRDYNIYAYGRTANDVQLLVIENFFPLFVEGRTDARLVNVSADGAVSLALAYIPSAEQVTVPTPDPTTAADVRSFRELLPSGTTRFVDATAAESISPFGPIPVGQQDIYVVDPQDNTSAVALHNINIEQGLMYDVVAFQDNDSPRVTAFVMAYSP